MLRNANNGPKLLKVVVEREGAPHILGRARGGPPGIMERLSFCHVGVSGGDGKNPALRIGTLNGYRLLCGLIG